MNTTERSGEGSRQGGPGRWACVTKKRTRRRRSTPHSACRSHYGPIIGPHSTLHDTDRANPEGLAGTHCQHHLSRQAMTREWCS